MSDNQLLLLHADGQRETVAAVPGLTVEFRGKGASIEIEAGSVFNNCKAMLGRNGRLHIGKTHARGLHNTLFDMAGAGSNCRLIIGRGTSIEGCRFAMGNESNLLVRIGRNCMLSSGIVFRVTDGHTIFDLDSREVLNKARPILIGDHVWIGAGTTILKGAEVPADTIIGTCSVVTGRFGDPHTAIAGNPARVVRRNIGWDRRHIPVFLRAQQQAQPGPETDESEVDGSDG